jgi:hypothetical protein
MYARAKYGGKLALVALEPAEDVVPLYPCKWSKLTALTVIPVNAPLVEILDVGNSLDAGSATLSAEPAPLVPTIVLLLCVWPGSLIA